MKIFCKVVVCASVLFLAKGIQAQTPADVPVIQIAKEGSSVRFAVKVSVSIEGTFDKWEATITYPSRHVEAGIMDIKIQADSVNTGSGMKDDKLKSRFRETSPYVESRSQRPCSSRLQAKGQVSARSRAQWPSTVRSLG